MEDFIPLIIVIAISIIGALSRKKKRIESENISTPNQRVRKDNDFLDWIEKLNVIEDDSPVYEENIFREIDESETVLPKAVILEEPVKKEVEPNKFSGFSGFITPEERVNLMSKEGISTVKKRVFDEGDLTQQVNAEVETYKEKPLFVFDIRNAIIYNEIINRKYT